MASWANVVPAAMVSVCAENEPSAMDSVPEIVSVVPGITSVVVAAVAGAVAVASVGSVGVEK